jgi:hypothetical protein
MHCVGRKAFLSFSSDIFDRVLVSACTTRDRVFERTLKPSGISKKHPHASESSFDAMHSDTKHVRLVRADLGHNVALISQR